MNTTTEDNDAKVHQEIENSIRPSGIPKNIIIEREDERKPDVKPPVDDDEDPANPPKP